MSMGLPTQEHLARQEPNPIVQLGQIGSIEYQYDIISSMMNVVWDLQINYAKHINDQHELGQEVEREELDQAICDLQQ